MSGTAKIPVILVDDHPLLLEGLRLHLAASDEIDILAEAGDGMDAVGKCIFLRPAVVIMDITMPMMNGLDATSAIREHCPEVKVLILSMHVKPELVSQALSVGAAGFLSKHSAPADLIAAIKTVRDGGTCFPEWFQPEAENPFQALTPADRLQKLSPSEKQVMILVASGLSSRRAAASLGLSVRTVEKHRERIMAKLNLNNVVELTRFAVHAGLVEVNRQAPPP